MNREQYAQQNTARMEKILASSATEGLSEAEALARLRKNGINPVIKRRENSVRFFFGRILKNGSLPLALVAFGLAIPFLGLRVLFPALLYLAFLGLYFYFSFQRARGVAALDQALLPRVCVIRDGKTLFVSPETLVVGDLISFSAGDILYAYAHITSDDEVTAYCLRNGARELYLKHGGDCFDGSAEPFNTLCPGDVIRDGKGQAFITAPMYTVAEDLPAADTVKNHGSMCSLATRVSFALAFLLLAIGFFRVCFSHDYTFLGECILIATLLIATASTSFYDVFFDLLFLYKNKKTAEKNGGLFVSVADAESVPDIDCFVLSTRSMFRSARYVARYFETAGGRRVTEKMRGTAELSLLADALYAMQRKCELSMEEQAVLGFSAKHVTFRRFELYAKSVGDGTTLTSYRSYGDGRSFSLVWGDAEKLIPQLVYLSEDGKTRLLDTGLREGMLDGVRRMQKNGFRFFLFAETQTRNTPGGAPQTFSDMKLLGFFALRKLSDEQAASTLDTVKREGKKIFFVHDGESADWLTKEVRHFDGVPILDGNRESFREELSYFIKDDTIPFCIGVHLSALQRAQVVSALETAGRHVAAAGTSFDDHRMMCAATAAIAPMTHACDRVPPLVLEVASLRAEEHVSSAVDTVRRASGMLGAFGVFTAALCASLLGRCAVALIGALIGKTFLSCGYYLFFGLLFDLLIFYSLIKVDSRKRYEGIDGLSKENETNLCLLAGFVVGSAFAALLASYVAFHPHLFAFTPGGFLFVSLLLMLNVGVWRFSSVGHSFTMLLFPIASTLTAVLLFGAGYMTSGQIGFSFRAEMLFWALFPVVVLMTVGKLLLAYLQRKNSFKVGENNERM